MTYRPITDTQANEYPYRILQEHCCEWCGCGFSSTKPVPQFCSKACYLDSARGDLSARASALWGDPLFVERIQSARKAAGYPDRNRPAAIAKRKMRQAAKNALHRCLAGSGTFSVLGYTVDQLIAHIESLLAPGMSWANYGDWEIDHRRPIASFRLDSPVAEINALSNLQPLWKMDNRSKGDVWI